MHDSLIFGHLAAGLIGVSTFSQVPGSFIVYDSRGMKFRLFFGTIRDFLGMFRFHKMLLRTSAHLGTFLYIYQQQHCRSGESYSSVTA